MYAAASSLIFPIMLLFGVLILVFIVYIIYKINVAADANFRKQFIKFAEKENFSYNPDDYFIPCGFTYRDPQRAVIPNTYITTQYNVANGHDYLECHSILGIKYKFCFLSLNIYSNLENIKKGSKASYPIFYGNWIVTDIDKEIKNPIQVMTKNFLDRHGNYDRERYIAGEKVLTESIEFNKRFDCYSNNQEDFFYIMTPEVIDILLGNKLQLDNFCLYFNANGQLSIIIEAPNLLTADNSATMQGHLNNLNNIVDTIVPFYKK